MSPKLSLGLVLIAITLVLSGCGFNLVKNQNTNTSQEKEPIKIGAILPLSGPVVVYGENIKNGMEIAKAELARDGQNVSFVFEDSQGIPEQGVSAFQKISALDRVDAVVSIFSRVSVPLTTLAKEKKIPLIMSIVSANNVADGANGVFRFYSTPEQYFDPHLSWINSDKYKNAAILAINDEFGADVTKVIENRLESAGIKVITKENYLPNSTDFKTQLTKIKLANPEVVFFISSVPGEISNILKQRKELSINVDFVEASASMPNVVVSQDLIKLFETDGVNTAEGVYSIAFPFTLNETGSAFKTKYRELFGKDPNYAASFGYDIVKLLAKADRDGQGQSLGEKIISLGNYDSLNGLVQLKSNGEINPVTYSVQYKDGQLIKIR